MIPKIAITLLWCFNTLLAQPIKDSLAIQNSAKEQFQNYFYEGLKQKGIENYDKAITSFVQCADLFPNRAVVWYELGDLYFKTKSYARAENNLQKAMALDQNNFWYKEKLYHLYIDQKAYDKAIKTVKMLLYKHQDYEDDLVNLYTETSRFDEAIKQINLMDDRYGYTPQRDRTRVDIYKRTNNAKAHLDFLEDRLKSEPDNPKNFLNLIYAQSRYDLQNQAFKTAEDFLAKHPKSHAVHVGLYKFYLEARQYDKAIRSLKIVTGSNILEPQIKLKVLRDFMAFVKEHPEYQTVLLDLEPAESLDLSERSNLEWAEYYQQQNNPEKAILYFEKTAVEFPENLNAIKTLAKLYLESKHYDRAVAFTTSKLELYPTQLELYIVYGKSQIALNNGDEATELLEQGLDFIFEKSDTAEQYYSVMVDLYNATNNIEKAKAFINKIKTLQSE